MSTLKTIGKLYGVGIGPGDPKYMTLRAAEVLRDVDVIFTVRSPRTAYSISRQAVESLSPRGTVRLLEFSMSRDNGERDQQTRANAQAVIHELQNGNDCAFATLGDAMTYSTFGYVFGHVREALPDIDVEIVPGVTSFAALAAHSGTVLTENGEQLRVIPAFKKEMADQLDFAPGTTTVLLKTYHSRAALIERLRKEERISVTYAERLGLPECWQSDDLDEIAARPVEYLSLMMVKKH